MSATPSCRRNLRAPICSLRYVGMVYRIAAAKCDADQRPMAVAVGNRLQDQTEDYGGKERKIQ